MKSRKRKPAPNTSRRRPYQPPKLGIYGDLRRVTKVKSGGMNDGAGKPMTKASGADA